MKIKRLGLKWGAAHSEAQPTLITADGGQTRILVYECEGGGLAVEFLDGGRAEVGLSTMPEDRISPYSVLVVRTE